MANELRMKGLAGIDMAEIPADGGAPLPNAYTSIGVTYRDEATFVEDDPSEIEHFSNENDDPEESDVVAGKKKLSFTLIDFDPDNLVKYLGGTVTGTGADKTWSAPSSKQMYEKAVRIRSKNGQTLVIPRFSFYAKIDYKLAPDGIAKLIVTGTVLTPKSPTTATLIKGNLIT